MDSLLFALSCVLVILLIPLMYTMLSLLYTWSSVRSQLQTTSVSPEDAERLKTADFDGKLLLFGMITLFIVDGTALATSWYLFFTGSQNVAGFVSSAMYVFSAILASFLAWYVVPRWSRDARTFAKKVCANAPDKSAHQHSSS